MSKLIPITIASIVLALLSHRFSSYSRIKNRYIRKERFFFGIMAVAMILFVGLRTSYNDTYTYQTIYNGISLDNGLFTNIKWLEIGGNPGFAFVSRLLKYCGFSTQSFLMFFAAISVGTFLWFIRKYSCNLPLSIFLFIAFAGYIFSLAAMKQCMAMALCLVATDRAIRGKYISFVLWVLTASLFHPYSLMYLLVPFLMFRPWSMKTVIMFAAFALAGVFLQNLLGSIVDITDLIGESFKTENLIGEGVNPFRLAMIAVPVLLSFITRSVIRQENDRVQNLMLNLTMLNAEIMFVALFGTAIYFTRLANYFIIFQAISIPWLFTHFERKSKIFITTMAVICYGLFFVYSQAIHETFDAHYYSISVWEYLASLLMG